MRMRGLAHCNRLLRCRSWQRTACPMALMRWRRWGAWCAAPLTCSPSVRLPTRLASRRSRSAPSGEGPARSLGACMRARCGMNRRWQLCAWHLAALYALTRIAACVCSSVPWCVRSPARPSRCLLLGACLGRHDLHPSPCSLSTPASQLLALCAPPSPTVKTESRRTGNVHGHEMHMCS
jgi:hypothetical protein